MANGLPVLIIGALIAILIAFLYAIVLRLGALYAILNDGFTMLGDFIALYKSHNENEKENHGT